MACRRSKSQEMRAAMWNVSSKVCLSGEVVDTTQKKDLLLLCSRNKNAWYYW